MIPIPHDGANAATYNPAILFQAFLPSGAAPGRDILTWSEACTQLSLDSS